MCEPTTIMLAVSAVTTGVSMYAQRQSAEAQQKALDKQNQVQADEISRQHGQQMTERAREARREVATARVLAGESGVNLGSGSFMAQLQQSAMNQYTDMGLVLQNEKSKQAARGAQMDSLFSQIVKPSWGEIAIGTAASGAMGYLQGKAAYESGAKKAPSTGGTK